MKKIVTTLMVFMLGLTLTTSAQKREKKGDFEKMTPEQRTELKIKKMTLKLDLTPAQVNKIKPLLLVQAKERKAMFEKHKALKESGKKPTADERFEMQSDKLDKQIAFKANMKRILNEEQYARFEKIVMRKAEKRKKSRKLKKRKKRENNNNDKW